METVGLDAAYGDVLEAFAKSAELGRFKTVPEVAEAALGLALGLTRSSVAYLALVEEDGADRRVFSRASHSQQSMPPNEIDKDEIDKIVAAAPASSASVSKATLSGARSTCAQPLQAGGRAIGMIGVASPSGYTASQQRNFTIFANQVATAMALAQLYERRQEMVDTLVNLRAELDRSERQRLVNEERARSAERVERAHEAAVDAAVDKARKRFAGDLHDDALQRLTAAEISLQRLRDPSGDTGALLAEAQDLLVQTEEALRRLLFEVRPPTLEMPGGFAETIRDRIGMLKSLSGAEVEVNLQLPDELSYDYRSMLYRQLTEAMTNIEKHAAATRVRISLTVREGGMHGIVHDNGRGFVPAERDRLPGHLGLLALNERALLAGGWNKTHSEPGLGTTVEFWMPLSESRV